MRRFATIVAVALLLAACGSSQTVTHTVTSVVTSSPTSAASTSTSATTTASSSTAAPAVPLCRASMLSLSYLGQQGATGHGELGFAVQNTSGHSCHTIGFPGVLFLDKAGAPLPTVPTHTTRDFFGVTPIVSLVIAPGAYASFRLGVTHGVVSPAACTVTFGLQMIPPNDTATLRTPIAGGAAECKTATVSPMRPDKTAFP